MHIEQSLYFKYYIYKDWKLNIFFHEMHVIMPRFKINIIENLNIYYL